VDFARAEAVNESQPPARSPRLQHQQWSSILEDDDQEAQRFSSSPEDDRQSDDRRSDDRKSLKRFTTRLGTRALSFASSCNGGGHPVHGTGTSLWNDGGSGSAKRRKKTSTLTLQGALQSRLWSLTPATHFTRR